MTDELKDLIKQYEEKGDFNYVEVTDDAIAKAETDLGLKLPEQYKEFLRTYGHGGIAGAEILGFGLTGKALFVKETLEQREWDLPEGLIVIENCDEFLYCIVAETGEVALWTPDESYVEYPDFDTFLLDRFSEAADNL